MREASLEFKKLVGVQCTSSGRSPNVNADTLCVKYDFHDLSLYLLRRQLVSEGARGTYLGQENRICVRDIS
jgi:hypothetical protein